MTLRVQCWSGPRNVSTALMYSWRQRADTTVYDEPFYAHYLALTGRDHPAFDTVVTSQSTDAETVIRDVILGPCPTPVFFMKQMAHHLVGVPRPYLAETENILLTRDPADMLPSLSIQLPDCGLADTGLTEQVELLDAILQLLLLPGILGGIEGFAAILNTRGVEHGALPLAALPAFSLGKKPPGQTSSTDDGTTDESGQAARCGFALRHGRSLDVLRVVRLCCF